MTISLIVQARSGSSRLKKKMTKLLSGMTLLEWVLFRSRKSKKSNQFILATTDSHRDKELISIGKRNRFKIFRGPERDVLKRYYKCSKYFKSKIIIRVCADNPLVDAGEIDFLITEFKKENLDYLYNTMQTKNNFNCDGFGAEIFSFKALAKAHKLAKSKVDREHVTRFIRNNKILFRSKCLEPKLGLNYPYLKFDVNTSQDLKDIKNFISKNKINKSTKAKKIVNMKICKEINKYLKILFPLNRSLTGKGNLKTLEIIKKITNIKIKKVSSTKGNLVYGEQIIPGKSKNEILISTYMCHPSMAKENLSGVILTAFLAKFINSIKNRYWTYRIIFVPETIGALAYLNRNEEKMKKIKFGLVISNVGGKGKFSYKKSFQDDHFLNGLIKEIFKKEKIKLKEFKFEINGSDERLYSSQFFKINLCSIFKDKYYDIKKYHSFKDNLNFFKPENIFQSLSIYQKLIEKIENQFKQSKKNYNKK